MSSLLDIISFDKLTMQAVRACASGNASETQQKRAMKWIVDTAANTHSISFRGEQPLTMTFNEGRRSVGAQVIFLLSPDAEKLVETIDVYPAPPSLRRAARKPKSERQI